MPRPTPGIIDRVGRILSAVGPNRTGQFLGIDNAQAVNITKGTARLTQRELDRISRITPVIVRHIDRLQHVVPTGLARADIWRNLVSLARQMDVPYGMRNARARSLYNMRLSILGLDPEKLPPGLRDT